MYKNKSEHGLNNICGQKIRKLRLEMKNVSQRKLADMLQVQGLDIDKNAIQRMESGKRFITDIELKALAKVLNVTYAELLKEFLPFSGSGASFQIPLRFSGFQSVLVSLSIIWIRSRFLWVLRT